MLRRSLQHLLLLNAAVKFISVYIGGGKADACSAACCKRCGHGAFDFDLFRYAVGVICEEYDAVNFVFECTELPLNTAFFRNVLRLEKEISRRRGIKFRNMIKMADCVPKRSDVHFCQKHKIALELAFTDSQSMEHALAASAPKATQDRYACISVKRYAGDELARIYNFAKPYCQVLRLKQLDLPATVLTNDDAVALLTRFKELFDMWIADADGIDMTPISDHIRCGLGTGIEKECAYSSCLGKALALDADGSIYICPHSKGEPFALGNIKNISLVSEAFDSEKFKQIVSAMIDKRSDCLKNCSIFHYCQSGCCADVICERQSTHFCTVLKEFDGYVRMQVMRILRQDEDLARYNPAFASIIRDAVCMNPIVVGAGGN